MNSEVPFSERTGLLIPAGEVTLQADLTLPRSPAGIVLFAHGSGSSRHSPRNRYVAEVLNERGLGTLLADLLTAAEEEEETTTRLRFDIALLTRRLTAITDWLGGQDQTRGYNLGLFGASTGAAAALLTAAHRPDAVKAVVCRGGRPDLAGRDICAVRAPTLLIVGGRDTAVLELNRDAKTQMTCRSELIIVRGATHLFEEPGALPEVAKLAAEWFTAHLRSNS
ncbi:MAG: dienelactone hydrolase family protein [Acidobacteriaceae bacterium]|nr:dienelactone hydrolase family protein [Acidobacteriaceae bacterium]